MTLLLTHYYFHIGKRRVELHADTNGFEEKLEEGSADEVLLHSVVPKNMCLQFLLHFGRQFQQYLYEMFLKGDGERISWLIHNQSKLKASDCTHLCDLQPYAANHKNETNQWVGNKGSNNALNVGRLIVLPSTYIGSDKYMRQKMHDIIAVSNSIGRPDVT